MKEKCRNAGVKYEGPGENEDYLLGSVDREEKERKGLKSSHIKEEKYSIIVSPGKTSRLRRLWIRA